MVRPGPIRLAMVAALLALVAAPLAHAATAATTPPRILTSPPRILASVAPGADTTATILVMNQSRGTEQVLLHVADLAPDDSGKTFGRIVDVGDAPRGAGAWLSIQQPTLTLGPGEQKSVPISIRVPTDADAGGHYGAIVVETSPSDDEQVRVRVRLVTHVNVLVPGNVRYRASLGDVRVSRLADGMLRVRARFENEGNIQTTPRHARIVVRGPRGSRSVSFRVPETIPDGTRLIDRKVRIPSAAGHFRTHLELHLEDGTTVRSRAVTTLAWRSWIPRGAIALAALLLVLGTIPLIRRRLEFRRLVQAELAQMDELDAPPDED